MMARPATAACWPGCSGWSTPSPRIAASVYDVHFDYLAWNEPYRRIRHDPAQLTADRRNLLWMMFTDAENRARMTTWDRAARVLLSQFRAAVGRHPGDPRFAELVAALTEASPQFRDWWAEYPVRYFRPAKIRISHPQAGKITLEMFQLRLEDEPRPAASSAGASRPRQPRPGSSAAESVSMTL